MHKKVISLFLLLAIVVMSGCGEQQKVKSVVKDFITVGLHQDDYSVVEWGRQDSTFHVSAAMLRTMRAQGVKGAAYARPTGKLILQRVTYVTGTDTIRQTFYLDETMTGVVGYKTDETRAVKK